MHRISHTPTTILILPDCVDYMMSRLHIDLSRLNDLLQYLGVLSCEVIHLAYKSSKLRDNNTTYVHSETRIVIVS